MFEFSTVRPGLDLGRTGWLWVCQPRVERFVRATGDPAARNLPLGLVIPLLGELLGGARMWVNYGLNRVRFPGPLPADAFVRLHASVMEVVTKDGAVQVTLDLTVEVQHQAEPACVAEAVFRYYP